MNINIQPLFHLVLLLVCLLFTIQFPVLSRSCHDYERNALLSFKSFLSDPSNRLSTWNEESRNCCNWYGIQCSDDSFHVISLNLRNTNLEIYLHNYFKKKYDDLGMYNIPVSFPPSTKLKGTISPSLFNLTHLQYLDLSFNDFQNSQIPHGFSTLKKLTHLDLLYSGFSGSLTTQFANLSSLTYLDLSCVFEIKTAKGFSSKYFIGGLKTSTNWLRGLVNLKVLRLNSVDLSDVSSTSKNWAEPISYLSNLRELDLSYCHINGTNPINDQFLNLSRLSSLKMSSNSDFNYFPIPVQLANLTSLSVLELSDCNVQGSIPYLPQLKELYVDTNANLTTDLTWMIKHWPKLHTLSMSHTHVIQSIPSSISNASSLVNLFASDCSIRGSFPSSISNLSQLKSLDLSTNKITGHLPSSILNHAQLKYLDLSRNEMTGHLPSSISKHSHLQVLDLSRNNMTGHLPSSFSNLKELQILDLSDNEFQGSIPLNSICKFSSLERLRFNDNNFTGRIPNCINNLQNLVEFYGAGNSIGGYLKGDIPISICNLTNLIKLDLSDNILIGAIPSCLFKLLNLTYICFSRNNLQGQLPLPPQGIIYYDLSQNNLNGGISIEAGRRLSNALMVSLSGNKLSGSIPFSLCSSKVHGVGLLSLNLSNNQFSGTIPSSLGYCTYLFSLHLSNNQFNGTIPSSLGNCNYLESLDLSNNQFSGTIPSSLKNCTYLLSLNLGRNNLTGNVPDELKQVSGLVSLQLNDNTLNGTFPNFVQQFKALKVLNLANNNFGGRLPTLIGSLHELKILSLRSNTFNGSIPKEINELHQLQIFDLSSNNFSGPIPPEISNLKMLTSRLDDGPKGFIDSIYTLNTQFEMVIKGIIIHYEHLYKYNSGIDLSCNNLGGNIPEDIGLLKELVMLNLSHNSLSGHIPKSLGNIVILESLDLSFNKLSGDIPQSLTSSMHSLGSFNLSYNNLSGRIPGGRHLETLSGENGSAYFGNYCLCGPPTNNSCLGDPRTEKDQDDEDVKDEDAIEKWLLCGIVFLGFGVGFWGLFLILLVKKEKWWFGYWRAIDKIAARIYGWVS